MSIPKIIHYCWMSGEDFPEDIQKCIDSWYEKMPDYQIKLWDKNSFDCNINTYTKQAMERKKYAFVSDYIRLYALYNEGGIYLDSDIEVFKSFDELLDNRAFTGFESGGRIGPWILASEKGNLLFKRLLDYYTERIFYDETGKMDLTPNTIPVTRILVEYGLKPKNELQRLTDITIYPEEYFCPKNPWNGKIKKTKNTYAMHYFKGAWNDLAENDLPFISNIDKYVAEFQNWMELNSPNKRVILYGMGVAGRNVLEQMEMQYPQVKIECILLTKLDNGWKSIDDIPIIEVDESEAIDRDIVVLVSTVPRYHEEIKKILKQYGYNHIYLLGKSMEKIL